LLALQTALVPGWTALFEACTDTSGMQVAPSGQLGSATRPCGKLANSYIVELLLKHGADARATTLCVSAVSLCRAYLPISLEAVQMFVSICVISGIVQCVYAVTRFHTTSDI
jgi:hypothetical protein